MIRPYIALKIPYGYALTRVDGFNEFVGIYESTEPLDAIANSLNLRQRDIIEWEMDGFDKKYESLKEVKKTISQMLQELHDNVFNELFKSGIPLISPSTPDNVHEYNVYIGSSENVQNNSAINVDSWTIN